MIRKLLITSVSALGLAVSVPALAQDDAAPLPTMDFGTWGVGTDLIDQSVDPGDDFNAYVNGKWIAATEIPADRSRFGAFDLLREKSIADVSALVRELAASNPAAGTQERRIVDAYNAYLNEDAINAAGLAPAQPYLDTIRNAPDLASLVALFEEPGYPGLVSASVTVDDRDPNTYVPSVGFSGMGLPSREYYLEDTPRYTEVRARYMDFLAFMLGQAGYADPASMAQQVYDFEHDVAEVEWARQVLRIPELRYNVLTRDELLALSPDFPLETVLETGGFNEQQRFLVSQLPPTAEEIETLGLTEAQLGMMGGGLPAMMDLLAETPLDTIKAYMAVRFLSGNASVLPTAIDDANFAFYGGVISGQTEQQARWKRAISAAEGSLGEQLGSLYADRYFPAASKAQMDELVANLRRAMRSFIAENEWMAPETRAQAEAKLDSFMPMIGYPDEFEAYDGLEIRADDPLGNRIRTSAWRIADNLAKLGGPVDRREWGMLPQTVNAYYNPVFNQIVFPAAILQAPFFNASADPAVNYGGIGAVIGHEMGHGFDDQGSQYDATGTLANWWTAEDRAGFEEMATRMSDMIDAYCPLDDGSTCTIGRLGLGETLGDVVGLQMAYRAYQLYLNGQEAPVIDGLTGDQRFFLGFAQVWRGKIREEALRAQIVGDPHPPSEFRLNNAVRHLDAWYDAFGVTPDDELYLPPEERIRIW
ncbi:M13 family metallopeptidase [Aurantiacibacter luteus]|uniref:Zinc metalloprotease n=1 Tax=Aurantiacibacter luteus TaxID=1581420 RepID=A0A0G9MY59_9SPHN|nr:M13 family metallopeptidase [Aurantiacibacter luteus]KLE34208.1 zinc metalloprotease [Aurantiacibacter luteus]